MNMSQWQKLILRWSPLEPTPEVKLLSGVIALAIEDCTKRAKKIFAEPCYHAQLSRTAVPSYCSLIGVSFDFLCERCDQAYAHGGVHK